MRHSLTLVLAGAALGLTACSDSREPTSPEAELSADRSRAPKYVVVLQDDIRDVRGVSSEIARGNGFGLERVRTHAARGFTAVIPDAQIDAVRRDPRVKIVERDHVVSLIAPIRISAPPPGKGPGGGGGGGGGGGEDNVPWGVAAVGGSVNAIGKRVYILDTGVDTDHPDLNVDPSCGRAIASRSIEDKNGHGTHVAGTIAAKAGNGGVVGVAAGATICAVQVLGTSGSGSYAGVIEGINFVAGRAVAEKGAVANMSLGGPADGALNQAVVDAAGKGVKFALAAGNEGDFASNHSPASANATGVTTVAAFGTNGCIASFSNFGPGVDVAAPGVGVLSTYKGGAYATASGTSMAAPHVAGLLLTGWTNNTNGTMCGSYPAPTLSKAHR